MDNIYIGGGFDLSLYSLTDTIYATGGETDGFVIKYGFPCTVGIEERSKGLGQVQVYPNPANNYFSVKTDLPFTLVKLLNYAGQVVVERKTAPVKELKVAIGDLPPGLYLVQLQAGKATTTRKVMVMQ
jgi:hypothetical protein